MKSFALAVSLLGMLALAVWGQVAACGQKSVTSR